MVKGICLSRPPKYKLKDPWPHHEGRVITSKPAGTQKDRRGKLRSYARPRGGEPVRGENDEKTNTIEGYPNCNEKRFRQGEGSGGTAKKS